MSDIHVTASPITLPSLPYAWGEPLLSGVLRQRPENFLVEEVLGFEPEGEGEHVFLWIEKVGLNTQQVADRLARQANVAVRQVSYCGMKDRKAVTRQWFSVHLPGSHSVSWEALECDELSVLRQTRHLRKLRRGIHRANRFEIVLTELESKGEEAQEELKRRVDCIREGGVPNYFGEQRFGHGGANLHKAEQWFAGGFRPKRHQKGLYLSAARSYLFNQVLAQRVQQQSWCTLLSGELLMLDGTHSVFAQGDETNLEQRLAQGDIHLTGPLYGRPGGLACSGELAALEQNTLEAYPSLLNGLKKQGLKAERRALRVIPGNLEWSLDGPQLKVGFSLPAGCFATAVVRELVDYRVD